MQSMITLKKHTNTNIILPADDCTKVVKKYRERLHLYQHLWSQTKWSLALWLTNYKALFVDKEHNICLFSVAKEAALNEQFANPCTLTQGCLKVHGGVPIVLCIVVDPL